MSDLKVTYLIFPGSAEETKGPPDLELWHERCSTLLEGIGGIGEGYELHQWEDLIAKKKAEQEALEKAKAEAEAKAAAEAASEKKEDDQEDSTEEEADAEAEGGAPEVGDGE